MSFNLVSNDKKGNHFDWMKKFAGQADTLILVSPFLSSSIEDMLKEMPTIKKIILYTNLDGFDRADIIINAISNLYAYCKDKIMLSVYCNDRLHGKVYLLYKVDEPKGFFITSGNFTDNGLKKNQEYGVFADDAVAQNDLLDRIKLEEYDEITFDDVIRMENEAKKFREKNRTYQVPVFRAKDFIKKRIKTELGTRYFLKMLGSSSTPYEHNRSLKEDNPIGISADSYEKFYDKLPGKGDIFICHGAGVACIVGYCRLLSDIPKQEKRYDGDKWNYKYYIEDLNPEYSDKWYEYKKVMKTFSLRKEFLAVKKPKQTVTLIGDSLGKINFGTGLIELTEDFALFVINKINEIAELS